MLRSLRAMVDGSTFWGGLAVVNFVLLEAQPAVLMLSGMLVGTLYAILWVCGAAGGGGGRTALRWLARGLLYYLAFCVTWVPVLVLVETVAGESHGPTGRASDRVMTASLLLTAGLWAGFFLWRRHRRAAAAAAERQQIVALQAADHARQARATVARRADQRRREDARAKAEIFFNLHAPELAGRFTRAMLDEFTARYLGDDREAADVEARADQVLGVMREHLGKVQPATATQSVEGLLTLFDERKRKIAATDLDPLDKETLLIRLDEEREAAVTRALREGRV